MIAYPWQLVDEKLHRQMFHVKIELYMPSTTAEEFWLTLKYCTTSASDNISSRVVMASR